MVYILAYHLLPYQSFLQFPLHKTNNLVAYLGFEPRIICFEDRVAIHCVSHLVARVRFELTYLSARAYETPKYGHYLIAHYFGGQ